jgi:predicted DNA-binding transcriptional regulator AlpA
VDPLADLPPVIDLMSAAGLLGLGRTTAYKLVRTGQWPTPVIRIGRLIKVPTAPLRDLLTSHSPPTSLVSVAPVETATIRSGHAPRWYREG